MKMYLIHGKNSNKNSYTLNNFLKVTENIDVQFVEYDSSLSFKDIYNKQMKYIKQLKKSLEQSEIVNDNIEEVCHKYKQTIKSLLSKSSRNEVTKVCA